MSSFLAADLNGGRVVQLLVNGLVQGAVLALLGASLALVLGVTKRFHVAYVATYVLAVYVGIFGQTHLGLPIGAAFALGLIVTGLVGAGLERWIYRPIANEAVRHGKPELIPVFIASLGVTIIAENLIAMIAGTQPRGFTLFASHALAVGSLRYTTLDIGKVVASVVLIGGLWVFLNRTRAGARVNAVRVNPHMASAVGVDPRRVFVMVFAISSILAGVLATLDATTTAASPQMGFDSVFYGFVVAFVQGWIEVLAALQSWALS